MVPKLVLKHVLFVSQVRLSKHPTPPRLRTLGLLGTRVEALAHVFLFIAELRGGHLHACTRTGVDTESGQKIWKSK
jgi:hypothetical protein